MTPHNTRHLPTIGVGLLLLAALWQGCAPPQAADSPTQIPTQAPSQHTMPITTLFIVRHAEKAHDPISDPDLTPQGLARAQRLAEHLHPAGITAIYSTSYRRNEQTAAPLAKALGLPITPYAPHDTTLLADIREKHQGRAALIVGHTNTIPRLLNSLLGKRQYEEMDEEVYGRLFVVTLAGEEVKVVEMGY